MLKPTSAFCSGTGDTKDRHTCERILFGTYVVVVALSRCCEREKISNQQIYLNLQMWVLDHGGKVSLMLWLTHSTKYQNAIFLYVCIYKEALPNPA